jgi:glucose/arabinose dehydrogenase/azurin
MTTPDNQAAGFGTQVFWGLFAAGAVAIAALVAILAGFLLGHYTHVRTKTVAERTITRQVATKAGTGASSASVGLTAGATVNLPAVGKMVSIGAGLTGAPGLSGTLWAQGPKNTGDVTQGPNGSVFVSTADETGKPDDGVYLVAPGATKPVQVIKGLDSTLGVVWHNNQLYVSTLGQVDVYTDFNGHSFGAERPLLTDLPTGMLGFNDQLILGPDGKFYMGIASPTDHSPPTKPLEATIVSFDPDGSDLQIYSYGVRGNSSLAFLPGTSDLFMATNQRNNVGKSPTAPPDEFGLVTRGSDWGYPYCWQQGGNACRGVSQPLVNDDQHAASDGITFVKGQWGSSYGTSAFVAEWTLGKVIRDQLTINDGVVTAHPQVILTNLANAGPMMTLPSGSVLVSSYATGKLYAIRPGSSSTAAAPSSPTASTSTAAASSTAVPAGAIPIAAAPTGSLMYNTKTLTAKAGKDTFAFTNKSSVGHNFTILKDGKVIGATPTFAGGVRLLTVTLAAGTYTFECTVPGHAQAGMKGTLTVTAGGAAASSTGTSSTSAAVPPGAIPIAAAPTGSLMYNTKTLTAKAGKDTFAFTNKSPVGHNFTILKGAKVIGATPTFAGGVRLLTVTLAAGTYTFECTVPGHAEAGMKGTLTVS